MTCTDVVFDFCGVLIDWRCAACLRGHVSNALIDEICADADPWGFFRYEAYMDEGQDFADVLARYRHEYGDEMADIFSYYIVHYGDSLTRIVPGMERLLDDLHGCGAGVWGLTNWSHETFHFALDRFPRLNDLLDGIVVSGVEKMHKPNANIYELALRRFGLRAGSTLFFDDTEANVAGARAVGMQASRFVDSGQARVRLRESGLSLPEPAA